MAAGGGDSDDEEEEKKAAININDIWVTLFTCDTPNAIYNRKQQIQQKNLF